MQTLLLYPALGRVDMTKVKFKIATPIQAVAERAGPLGLSGALQTGQPDPGMSFRRDLGTGCCDLDAKSALRSMNA
jgi:hypothetical protein